MVRHLQDLARCLLIMLSVGRLARANGRLAQMSAEETADKGEPEWQCKRPGRFSNPADPSCRTYFTCIPEPDPEDGFVQRLDQCGTHALFSGRYQRCITGSDCATLEDFYAIEYECSECGKFVLAASNDCRQFVNCLKTKDPGVFVPIRQSCPAGRLFSATVHGCLPEDTVICNPSVPTIWELTASTITTTTTTTMVPTMTAAVISGHLSDFVCLGPGRFPDESVPHCRGYRWCTTMETTREEGGAAVSQFVSRSFLCDSGQVFSETAKRCVPVASYQCSDDDEQGVATDRFHCTVVGRFPDRGALGCERYYHCQETASGILMAVLKRCPAGTVFSWLMTHCIPAAEYVCPFVTVHDVAKVLKQAAPHKDSEALGIHHCSRSGRFANSADVLCRTYFICTRDVRGAWAKVLVRCPDETVFSRSAARCVSVDSQGPQESCANVNEDDSQGTGSAEDFTCTDSDLVLPNPADRTCTTYFRCSQTDPDTAHPLRLHLFSCLGATRFSTVLGRCINMDIISDNDEQMGDQGSTWTTIDDEPLLPSFCTVTDQGSGEFLVPEQEQDPWMSVSVPQTVDMTTYLPPKTTTIESRTTVDGVVVSDTGELGTLVSYSGHAPEYPCTATGRFADINSVDCRFYFLCKQQQPGGSLLSVHLTCPDGMVFSRNVNKCIISNRHVC